MLDRPVSAGVISRVDTIGIPSSDTARSREFYVDTLGLHKRYSPYMEQSE
jgi:catechol 2,3-dioxygenase-like lactoylglutathione lyase family enzyme